MRFVLYGLISIGLLYVGVNHERFSEVPTITTEVVSEDREPLLFSDPDHPMKCTFSSVMPSPQSDGVAYIAGSRMSTQSDSYVGDTRYTAHSYSDGLFMHIWSEGASTRTFGMRYPISADSIQFLITDPKTGEAPPLPFTKEVEGVTYACEGWNVDETVFSIPEEVEFLDEEAVARLSEGAPYENPDRIKTPALPEAPTEAPTME